MATKCAVGLADGRPSHGGQFVPAADPGQRDGVRRDHDLQQGEDRCLGLRAADAVIGNNALRRFNVIFDYTHQKLHIRLNSHFSEPFK